MERPKTLALCTRCVHFYRNEIVYSMRTQLSWTHLRLLMFIECLKTLTEEHFDKLSNKELTTLANADRWFLASQAAKPSELTLTVGSWRANGTCRETVAATNGQ